MQTRTFSRKGSSKVSRKASTDVGASLVKSGLVFAALKKYGMIDVIGLSISDAPNIREEFWLLFFTLDGEGQPVSLLDAETIIVNIQASSYLNNGWELAGNETKGYALYAEGSAMYQVYRYFRQLVIAYQEDGALWLQEDGTQVYQEGVPA